MIMAFDMYGFILYKVRIMSLHWVTSIPNGVL